MASPAPACTKALSEATELWPNRSTASDGIMASKQHQKANPNSDHSLGNAYDLTHDPDDGVHCGLLSEYLKDKGDPRVKYIIWNRRIWNPSISPNWRVYNGTNPHTKHMHVSINSWLRDDVSTWWVKDPEEEEDDLIAVTVPRQQGGYILLQIHDGGVFAYDGAPFHGSLPGVVPGGVKVLDAAWTPSGNGYWILGADGGVFSFGDAEYKGGFNTLPDHVKGDREPVGIVSVNAGYRVVAFDPSQDGSPYDGYNFGV